MMHTWTLATGWEFRQGREKTVRLSEAFVGDWTPAQVPGHVHLDLVRAGVIAHPFWRMGEIGCQWVDGESWVYRTVFDWKPVDAKPVRRLVFEGLDTVCDIYLNGDKVASHDNMFIPLVVDVSEHLVAGPNELRVEFASAVGVGEARQADYFAKHGLRADTKNFEERAFVRKAQYMFGWDWGPRLVGCGIWKPVRLVEGTSFVEDLWVRTSPVAEGWRIDASFRLSGEGTGGDDWTALIDEVSALPVDWPELVFVQEEDGFFRASLVVADAEEWWPNGLGDQPVYELNVFRGVSLEAASRFGFKTVELVREDDELGQSFTFRVNGLDINAMGANWIPDSSFPGAVRSSDLEHRIADAAAMGMNMLRVWGGGLYESEEFYDLCDAYGILVWQDFPYGCSYYPDDADHLAVAKREASAALKRIRNRVSLAVWCGNNENYQMFDDKWGGAEFNPERLHGQAIYEEVLEPLVEELDPGRPYIRSSAYGKDERWVVEPDRFTHNMGRVGDSHYWDVWHGRGDWKHYADSTTRFSSEFGFCSAPSVEALESCLDAGDWQPFGAVANWHNKTRKPVEDFRGMVESHYPPARTVEDWVYTSQLNQRDALRFGVEHFRRGRLCRGTLIWQLNDCWPVQSWALIDGLGHWKAAAHEMTRLYRLRLGSLVREENSVVAHVINGDPGDLFVGGGTLKVVDLHSGVVGHEVELAWSVGVLDSVEVGRVELAAFDPSRTIVVLEGDVEAWCLIAEPKDVSWPAARVVVAVVDGGEVQVSVDGPVVDLWLREPESGAQFHPNFLTSAGPAVWVLDVEGDVERVVARSLSGDHPVEITRSPLV